MTFQSATLFAAPPVLCPLCGGPMQLCRGLRGHFLGCTRFPACRGTRPVKALFRPRPVRRKRA